MREEVIRLFMLRLEVKGGYRTRDWVQFHCPFAEHTHRSYSDRSASFGVQINKKGSSRYWCFSCRQSGKLYELPLNLSKYGLCPDHTTHAQEIIAAETEQGFGLFEDADGADEVPEPLADIYDNLYDAAWGYPEAREFLVSRGVNQFASEHMGLGFDEDEARVTFPVYGIDNDLYGYTGRSILPEKEYSMSYPKQRDYLGLPKKHVLLNCHNYQPGQRVGLMEGPLDVARSVSNGALDWNVLPVAMLGTSMSVSKADLLVHMGGPVVFMLDNDEAGDIGTFGAVIDAEGNTNGRGACDILRPDLPVGFTTYPENIGDPGEMDADSFAEFMGSIEMEDSLCPLPQYF